MRPRVFPAEDCYRSVHLWPESRAFNEAAGIPRGRRGGQVAGKRRDRPSMRPRVFPAEDAAEAPNRGQGRRPSMRPRVFPAEDSRQQRAAGAAGWDLQ